MERKRLFCSAILGTLVLIVFCIGIASAEIGFKVGPEKEYRLGMSVGSEIEILLDSDEYFILGAQFKCEKIELNFYKNPLFFKKNIEQNIILPSVPINEKMGSECIIKVSLEDFEGKVIEQTDSDSFLVTSGLNLDFSTDKEEYLPGEKVILSGNLSNDAETNLTFYVNGIKVIERKISGKSFAENIYIEDNYTKQIEVRIVARDMFGNEGEKKIELKIKRIPKKIAIEIGSDRILPGREVDLLASLYDQSEELMEGNLIVEIRGPDNRLVEKTNASSGQQKKLKIGSFAMPGKYIVEAKAGEIAGRSEFLVDEVLEIVASLSGNKILLKNIGNVRYVKNTFLNASSGEIVYLVPVSLDIGPNEFIEIDLSKELPEKAYNISFGEADWEESFEGVLVTDERSIQSKVSQGLSRLTGSTVIDTRDRKGFVGVIMFVLVILTGFAFFSMRRLKKLFRDREFKI